MRYIILTISIIISLGFQISNSDKSEIENLYAEALNHRFDLLLTSGYKYIEINEMTSQVKDKIPTNSIYKFLNNEELIKLALREKRDLNIYRMTHREISNDTIDINFSHLRLSAKKKVHWNKGLKFKKAEFRLSCGGTDVYEPDFRFVKQTKTDDWKLVKNKFVLEEK